MASETSELNHVENIKSVKENDYNSNIGMDEILKYIGELGLYQKFLILWMALCGAFIAFVYFVQFFIAATPQNHWCWVPELGYLDIALRRNLTAPYNADGLERCKMYNVNWSEVIIANKVPPDTPTIPCRQGWEYELSDIPYQTVVTERDWVCDKASFVPLTQSTFFVGSFVGGILFGRVADKYGRVPAIFGTNMIAFFGGIATIYSMQLWDYTLSRFVVGTSYDGCFIIMYILVLEYVDPKYRSLVANISTAITFGGTAIMMPWLALWVADWRKLLWVTTLPMILVIFVPFTVPESVRWLTSRGRINTAVKVLKRFEKVNGKNIPQDAMDQFILCANRQGGTDKTLIDLFKSPPLRKVMFELMAVYMSCGLIFDGLIRILQDLGLDFFLTFSLSSLTEIPALILLAFTLDKFGRKKLISITFWLISTLIFITVFSPKGLSQVVLAIIARFFINMGFTASIQWSTELLPTEVRASGFSFIHIMSYVAYFLSPYVVYSGQIWSRIPLIILGGVSLFAGGITLLLPETNGLNLPQTIEEWEKVFNKSTIFGTNTDVEKNIEKDEKQETLIS